VRSHARGPFGERRLPPFEERRLGSAQDPPYLRCPGLFQSLEDLVGGWIDGLDAHRFLLCESGVVGADACWSMVPPGARSRNNAEATSCQLVRGQDGDDRLQPLDRQARGFLGYVQTPELLSWWACSALFHD
jgi:hypothetical protein